MRALLVLVVAAACGSKPPSPAQAKPEPSNARPAPPGEASPYDAKVWIEKLADPREVERAVTQLEQLGNPSAIGPLGEAWLAQGRPVRMLVVMIGLARPLTAQQAKDTYFVDYEQTGRPASWDKALPYLMRALTEVDEANPRSVDSALKAADALAEAKLGADALVELAQRPVTKKLIAAQVAAVRALGGFAGDANATRALLRMLDRDPPVHPRMATDKEQGRQLEERFGLYLAMTGATINALAVMRPADATGPLVLAMYKVPELFTQVRRALVSLGPKARDELRDVLRGKHAGVNALFKAKKLDQYCGDRGDSKECQPVSAREFYPAVVLGDFYDPAVVPDLLVVLDHPPAPSYFIDDAPGGNTQYNAVFDALRKIGSPTAAAKVKALAFGKADIATRVLAIDTHPFVARNASTTGALGKIAADNNADDQLRQASATALARLSIDAKDIRRFDTLAKKYIDASAKKSAEAAKYKQAAEAADKSYEAEKVALQAAKDAVQQAVRDSSATADQIRAAAINAKRAEDAFRAAKLKHKDAVAPFKQADAAAKAYLGYARMFQTHGARIEVAVRCKQDASCYAATLAQTVDEAVAHVKPFIKDVDTWTADEKRELVAAAIDRAMLELGKLGVKASGQTDALLGAAASDDQLIRGAVLIALPKITKVPCASCVTKLDAAIRAGEGKSNLGSLNVETQVLRNYFKWAGGASE